MMKVKIITNLFILFAFFSVGYSRGNWELLVPSGTSNQMVSLYFLDELNGWSVGQYGTITKTNDGGITWQVVEIDYLTDLTDVHFPSVSVGYVIGEDGLILKTSDGGVSWDKQENYYSNNLNRVKFRDEETGWVIGESGLILHTTDGGVTWNQQASGCQYSLYGIEIPDGQKVWVVGEADALLVTEDDGTTWQKIDPHYNNPLGDNIEYNYRDIFFANDSTGWACGRIYERGHGIRNGFIAQTLNGGKHWSLQRNRSAKYKDHAISGTGPLGYPQQIYYKDDLTTRLCLVAADADNNNNTPFYSRNINSSWTVFIDGIYEWTSCKGRFQFLTGSRVINTGFQGDIRFSDDSGQNWYFNNSDGRFWQDFQIGPDNTLHVLKCKPIQGTYDEEYIHLISEDHGVTWKEVISKIHYLDGSEKEIDNIYSLGKLTLTSDPLLFAVHWNWQDTNETILYSDDMGINYYELRSDVAIECDKTGWRFLTPDTLITTRIEWDTWDLICQTSYDGGETITRRVFGNVWNNLTGNNHHLPTINDSYFFNSHTGFIVGDDGNILKTEDAGQSWANIYSGIVEDLQDIEFIERETGFVVGAFGRILKTTDGGATWRKTNSGTQENIFSIAFLNENEGWVGTKSGMRYTTDSGESWHGVPLRYQHGPIRNIKFDNDGNGYAYSLYSAISMNSNLETKFSGSYVLLQRMLNGATGFHENENANQLNPGHIRLYANYPNPFNSSTHIEYYLPREGVVKIKIFNISGQIVRTLVNESQKSGRHSATWDGQSDEGFPVSSGLYLYKLQSNDQVKTRKLLMLK